VIKSFGGFDCQDPACEHHLIFLDSLLVPLLLFSPAVLHQSASLGTRFDSCIHTNVSDA
jgi:hypothetical protein